ncbi:MAG TPA: PDZ domain-containing protein [Ktedonobacterales bacterium]|nr:PDZ domain-containing protein [Ktedonobacterales bacterium]
MTSTGQGFLGIQGQDVTAQLAAASGLAAQQGVLITGFAHDTAGNSPAQQAGLQTDDVIVAVNGQPISGNDDLAAALLNQQPGTKVTLTIERGSAQRTVTVTLGERPVSGQG